MNRQYLLGCLVWGMLCCQQIFAQNYTLEQLSPQINTSEYDEIAPSVSPDGQMLFFTRVGYSVFEKTLFENGNNIAATLDEPAYLNRLKGIYGIIAKESVADPVQSGFNQDVWIARSVDGTFDRLSHPSFPLNNALPNSISSLSHLPNEVIVINQFVQDGGMQKGFSRTQQLDDGSWTFPQPININNYHNSGPDVNMTLSSDGMVMILALERSDSYGRSDLYVCTRTGDNSWSEPKNLGPYVNTVYRETTPYLSADGKTLYYASDRGNNSRGGSDIFVQTRQDESWEVWTAPKRFRFPINSKSNDSHPCFNEATGHLYFTSDRMGSSDIYRIQIEEPKPRGEQVHGIVINEMTGKQEAAAVITAPSERRYEKSIHYTDDGAFKITLPFGESYEMIAKKEGFVGQSVQLSLSKHGKGAQLVRLYIRPEKSTLTASVDKKVRGAKEIVKKPPLVKVVKLEEVEDESTVNVGMRIDLEKIYFEQSKAHVLKKSLQELNKLGDFLDQQQHVTILIAGHTDNQGEKASLLQLSRERAEAIKNYLVIKRHIDPLRIKTVGYGAQFPVNDNSNERLRRQNRRVEIEIIDVEESRLDSRARFEGG